MIVGILAALDAEARALGFGYCPPGVPVRHPKGPLVCVSGMGPACARRAAGELLAAGAGAILSIGFAGGLAPTLGAGSALLPARVLWRDEEIDCDAAWRARLGERLGAAGVPLTRTDAWLAVEEALVTAAHKQAAFARSGAAGIDMESGAAGEVARAGGRPFAVLRVIVDGAQTAVPPLIARLVQQGRVPGVAPVLAGLLREPQALPALLRLGADHRRAQARLRQIAASGALELGPPAEAGAA